MSTINLHLDGDGCWPDLAAKGKKLIHLRETTDIGIAALSGGTVSGRPSVMFRLDLPDGSVVLAETTMRLFLTVADAMRARYGDEV